MIPSVENERSYFGLPGRGYTGPPLLIQLSWKRTMLSLFNVSDDFTALSINIKCLSRIELGIVIDEDGVFKILGVALRKLAVI